MNVAGLSLALAAWAGAFAGESMTNAWAIGALLLVFAFARSHWLWVCATAFVVAGAWRDSATPLDEAPQALQTELFVLDAAEVVEAEAPWAPVREVGLRAKAFDLASHETWWVYGDVAEWRPGDCHVADGVRRPWAAPAWDGDTLARSHGTDATFHLAIAQPCVDAATPSWSMAVTARLARWRLHIGTTIYEATGRSDGSAMSAAIVIGDRRFLRRDHLAGLTRAGLVHVLSVSGFHVAWVAWLARWLVTLALGPLRLVRAHDSRQLAAFTACVTALAYALLSGAELPALRSAAMWGVPLLGVVIGRRGDTRAAFATTLLASIALAPTLATSPGAAFSFFTVLILLLSRNERSARWKEAVSVAAWATAAAAPWSAYYFASVPWLSIPFNLLAGPLAAGVVAIGLVWCALGAPMALAFPLQWVGDALALLAQHTPTWATAPLALSGLEVALSCVLILVVRSPDTRRLWPWLATLGLVVFATPWLLRLGATSFHFLPVGQGDAAVIFDGAHTTVVDTGGDFQGRHDPGARVIVPFLLRQRVWHVDDLVLSHAHPDHVGGAATLLDRLWVDRVWANGPSSRHPAQTALAQRRGSTPVNEQQHPAGFTPLHPLPDGETHYPELALNDNSIVLSHAGVLFTGDIEALAEDSVRPARHTLLKVAHHGSDTSTTAAFLSAVQPHWCVVSVGAENRFGHPSPRVLERMHDAGCHIFRTDLDGLVTLTVDAHELCLRAHRRMHAECLQVE